MNKRLVVHIFLFLSGSSFFIFGMESPSKKPFNKSMYETLRPLFTKMNLEEQSTLTPFEIEKEKTGDSELHVAARKNDVNAIRKLLIEGIEVNLTNNKGETPLHTAAGNDSAQAIRQLFLAGADPLLHDNNGLAALDHTLNNTLNSNDITGMFKYELSKRVKNDPTHLIAQLVCAIENNYSNTIFLILAHYPKLILTYNKQEDSLSISFNSKNITLKEVTKSGIDKNFLKYGGWSNSKGQSMLHIYCASKKPEEIFTLLGYPILHNTVDLQGETPLMYAIKAKRTELMPMLCSAGCIIALTDNFGNNLLHHAVQTKDTETIKKSIKYCIMLLKNQYPKKTIQTLLNQKNIYNYSPLEAALQLNLFDVVEFMKTHGAILEPDTWAYPYNEAGQSVLHQAVLDGNTNIVTLLLEAGFPANTFNGNFKTVLDVAPQTNNQIIQLLKKYGAKKSSL